MNSTLGQANDPFDDEYLKEIIPRLIKFARKLMRDKYWYGQSGGNIAAGMSGEDFVIEAFTKFYAGDRKWNQEKYPQFINFMYSVIRSLVSHQCLSHENKNTHYLETPTECLKQSLLVYFNKANLYVLKLFRADFMRFLKRINPEEYDKLLKYNELWWKGYKMREIAEHMRCKRNNVYNIRKRWKRLLKRFYVIWKAKDLSIG